MVGHARRAPLRVAGGAVTPREKKAARLQREADAWNAKHPVGTRVRYWRGGTVPGIDAPTGEGAVRAPAQPMSDHVSVWIEGHVGSITVRRVEAVTVPLRKPRRERASTRCGCGAPAMEGGVGLCGPCTFGEADAGGVE